MRVGEKVAAGAKIRKLVHGEAFDFIRVEVRAFAAFGLASPALVHALVVAVAPVHLVEAAEYEKQVLDKACGSDSMCAKPWFTTWRKRSGLKGPGALLVDSMASLETHPYQQ